MKSESLKHVRTMRDLVNSLEVCLKRRVATHNSLSSDESVKELVSEESLGREDKLVLEKERRRLRDFYNKVEKSQNRLLQLRGKMAHVIRKNKALMKTRKELQDEIRPVKHEPKKPVKKRAMSKNQDFEY